MLNRIGRLALTAGPFLMVTMGRVLAQGSVDEPVPDITFAGVWNEIMANRGVAISALVIVVTLLVVFLTRGWGRQH